ncbi:MAG: BlaI/MecI/CopY family transcriptional regulator [Bryobacterales bacterium]|jgi:predicted transcriptional regulator|nr:BlaI/MecI/CopY family transcriptional regulator [Bryobacterales bacterium]
MAHPTTAEELPPPLELACLNVLWRVESANVSEVREALLPGRPLAYTTVMTLLDRLEKRGLVARQKQGRSFRYHATVARPLLQRLAVEQLVERLFDGSVDELRGFVGASQVGSSATPPVASSDTGSLDAALL